MCDRPLQYKRNRRSHLLKLVFSKNVAFFNLVPLQVCDPKAWFQSMFCMFRIFLFNQTPDAFRWSICAPHFSLVPKALLLLMTRIQFITYQNDFYTIYKPPRTTDSLERNENNAPEHFFRVLFSRTLAKDVHPHPRANT